MAKRKWTEEERKAFGERMKKARLDKETHSTYPPEPRETPVAEQALEVEVITLDLTKENLVNEASVTELVRRMFDDGNYPDVIKVTSHQMIETFDPSSRLTTTLDGFVYRSPLGEHWIDVIARKELDQNEDS